MSKKILPKIKIFEKIYKNLLFSIQIMKEDLNEHIFINFSKILIFGKIFCHFWSKNTV